MHGSRTLVFAAVATAAFVAARPVHAGTWEEDDAAIAACFAAMDRDSALAVVNAKFARGKPSAAQLGDRALPSEAEAEALRTRIVKTRPCRTMRLDAVRAHHPLLEGAYTILYYQADQVFADLSQRAISYGIANTLAAAALDQFETRRAAYFAGDATARETLAAEWRTAIERAHSDPPPSAAYRDNCRWREINVVCE